MIAITQFETTARISEHIQQLELQVLSPATLIKYKQQLRDYQSFLQNEPVSESSAKLFLGHLRNRGFSPATVDLYYHALKPFLLSQGIILKVKFHKSKHLPVYHTVDQVKAILDAVHSRSDNWDKLVERDYLVILMLAYTGMRRSELVSLKLSDVDFYNKELHINGKGDKDRNVPIHPVLFDRLQKYTTGLRAGDTIFRVKPHLIWLLVVKYAAKAGIYDIHPHSFRHFFATQLVENNVPLHQIKDLLGHSNINTTAIYLDIRPKHLEAAVSSLPDLRG